MSGGSVAMRASGAGKEIETTREKSRDDELRHLV